MATDLSPADFAEAIGVPLGELAALERDGLPFVNRKKEGRRYPLPAAIRWFVGYSVTNRVGGIPPRTTQSELATLVGYTPRQITNLVNEQKVATLVERGKRVYPLPQAVIEIIAHREAMARGKSGEKVSELEEAKTRKAKADAELAELQLMRERGEVISRLLAVQALGEMLQALKGQLIQFAPRYEADFVGLDSRLKVRAVLKPAVNAEIQRLQTAAAQVGRRIEAIAAAEDVDDESDDEEADGIRDAS